MKRSLATGFALAALCAWAGSVSRRTRRRRTRRPAKPAPASDNPHGAAGKPGVFTAQKKGANGYHLVVAGHKFSYPRRHREISRLSRSGIDHGAESQLVHFCGGALRGDTVPVPQRDPAGLRYSFRMDYWRPVWRYKVSGSPAWKSWSSLRGRSIHRRRP
jgi:hypothetical protein